MLPVGYVAHYELMNDMTILYSLLTMWQHYEENGKHVLPFRKPIRMAWKMLVAVKRSKCNFKKNHYCWTIILKSQKLSSLYAVSGGCLFTKMLILISLVESLSMWETLSTVQEFHWWMKTYGSSFGWNFILPQQSLRRKYY